MVCSLSLTLSLSLSSTSTLLLLSLIPILVLGPSQSASLRVPARHSEVAPLEPRRGVQINFNFLIPFEKKGARKVERVKEEGELKKQARSLFEFLIAGAQNVTYRCEILHLMKY